MKRIAYLGMFLLAACSSAPANGSSQAATSAATPTPSCCQTANKADASCCDELAAPAASAGAGAGASCCEQGAKNPN